MSDKKTFITARQLSDRWGGSISTGTLNNWRALGVGPKFHKFGGRVLYRISDVEQYEAEHMHGPDHDNDNSASTAQKGA